MERAISLASAAILTAAFAIGTPSPATARPAAHSASRAVAQSVVGAVAGLAPKAANGMTCTIWGTNGKNHLVGTSRNDVICGLGGNDTISGGGGNDVIDGGSGNDTLKGGAGNDVLIGGSGNDKLDGQSGVDTVSFVGTSKPIKVTLASHKKQKTGLGTDTIANAENLTGGSGNDTLTGDKHANTIDGGPGRDKIKGGSSDDTLVGGPGNDTLDGQSGVDRASFADVTSTSVRITASLSVSTAQNTGDGVDILLGDEGLTGGAGDDTLTGNSSANILDGGAGNDILTGGGGNDSLTGDAGNDTLTGGDGDDRLNGGLNPDNLDGGSGANVCTFDAEDTVAPNCDGTAPQVVSISLSTTTVDTSASDQTITIAVHLTDDLAGVRTGVLSFFTPGAGRSIGMYIYAPPPYDFTNLVSGDALDGTYTSTVTIPQGTAAGTWSPTLDIEDRVGNRRILNADALARAGIVASFSQVGGADAARPALAGLELSRTTVDASASDQTITVSAHVTDDTAVNTVMVSFSSPKATGQHLGVFMTPDNRVSGTAKDGIYQATITVPRYAAEGFWKIDSVDVSDRAGNTAGSIDLAARGFPTGFTKIGAQDLTAPTLVSLNIDPTTVNAADSAQTITITAHVSDAPAGVKLGLADFHSRAISDQSIMTYWDTTKLVDGTATDGTFRWTMELPRYSASGRWDLHLQLLDQAGNSVDFTAEQLEAKGFTSGFTVN